MKNLAVIIKSLSLVAILVIIAFFPGVRQTIQGVIENGENFQPVYVNVGDFNVKWDVKFDLPEFQFDAQEFPTPTLNLNLPFIIIVAIIAIVLIFLSSFYRKVSLVITVLFGGLGVYFSIQAVNVYKNMLLNGSTHWDAASACFGFLFCLYLVVLANGLLGIISTVLILWLDDGFSRCVFGTFIAAAFAALGSLVASGLCWLILGLGWAGGVYLSLAISFIVAMVGEFMNGSLHSSASSSENDSQYNEVEDYNSNYDYDYEEDYE